MSKKIILLALLITLAYFTFYLLLSKFPRDSEEDESPFPSITLPLCEENDQALLLTVTGVTICKDGDSLYFKDSGKKKEIQKIKVTDYYFPSSLNLIVFTRVGELVVQKLLGDMSMQVLYTLSLPSNVTPIAIILTGNKEVTTVFVSAQHDAKSEKDFKGILYKIELSNSETFTPRSTNVALKEMLCIVDIYDDGKYLVLRELFPFLVKKHRSLNWKEQPELRIETCQQFISLSQPFTPFECPKLPETEYHIFIKETAGNVEFDTKRSSLVWHKNGTQIPNTLISNVNPEEWEVVAKYSTIIGKRVYNCIDFSESLELTLRTCITEL